MNSLQDTCDLAGGCNGNALKKTIDIITACRYNNSERR